MLLYDCGLSRIHALFKQGLMMATSGYAKTKGVFEAYKGGQFTTSEGTISITRDHNHCFTLSPPASTIPDAQTTCFHIFTFPSLQLVRNMQLSITVVVAALACRAFAGSKFFIKLD